jgi:hypothetical protein
MKAIGQYSPSSSLSACGTEYPFVISASPVRQAFAASGRQAEAKELKANAAADTRFLPDGPVRATLTTLHKQMQVQMQNSAAISCAIDCQTDRRE